MQTFTHRLLIGSSQQALGESQRLVELARAQAARAPAASAACPDRSEPFLPVACEACGARGRLLREDVADWADLHPRRCRRARRPDGA